MRALENYLGKIRPFRKFSREEFIREDAVHDLAERYLHLAMESVLDVANHFIADRGLAPPETFKDSFRILAEAGIVPGPLSEKLQLWAGFRNILVHEYLTIDHGIAYDALSVHLGELEEFARIAAGAL